MLLRAQASRRLWLVPAAAAPWRRASDRRGSRARLVALPEERLARATGASLDKPHICSQFWQQLDKYGLLPSREERRQLLEACARPARAAARANTLKLGGTPPGEWMQLLARRRGWRAQQVPWASSGFFLGTGQDALGATQEYASGAIFVQEATSMLPAEILWHGLAAGPPSAFSEPALLDLCAAPGGKACHLAALLAGRGLLVAADASEERCRALRANLVCAGAANAVVQVADGRDASSRWPECFDGVLVDAPCSGSGTVRKNRAVLRRWPSSYIAEVVQLQRALLRSAWGALRPGGLLVYCTCSLGWDENEGVVQDFLREFAGEASAVDLSWVPGLAAAARASERGCLRVWPHLHDTDGFFVAALRKAGAESPPPPGAAESRRWRPRLLDRLGCATAEMAELSEEQEAACREALHRHFGLELPLPTAAALRRRGRRVWLLPPAGAAPGLLVGALRRRRAPPGGGGGAAAAAPAPELELQPSAELMLWGEGLGSGGPHQTVVELLGRRVLALLECDVAAFNAAINACAEEPAYGLPACELWLRRMLVVPLPPDLATYGTLIKAAARFGDPAAAEHWFARMEASRIRGDVVKYAAVVDAHAREGDGGRAEAWLLKLCKAGVSPNVVAFASLLKAFAHTGDAVRAEEWLRRMAGAAVQPNSPCYSALARARARVVEGEGRWG